MNLPDGLFSLAWTASAFGLLALLWIWCFRTGDFRELARAEKANVWMGSIVAITLLWSMKAGIRPGLNLHLLGATALTLMFGAQRAIVALSLAMAAVTLNGGAAWAPYALNVLLMAALPCLLSQPVLRLTERYLPGHLFVYIFSGAFFGAAWALVTTALAAAFLLWLADVYPAESLQEDFLPPFLLLSFAEAWLNGAAITLMVVYKPHWVCSFNDQRYLGRNH
jgi:uncharacterized membrane protein